jgi:group I intron endonuclease
MKSGIYFILCIPANKIYIGSSKNITGRLYNHKLRLQKGTHANSHLLNAWKKYGGDSFLFKKWEEWPDDDTLRKRELFWMKKWNCFNNEKGFNIVDPTNNTRTTKRVINPSIRGTKRGTKIISIDSNGNIQEHMSILMASSKLNINYSKIIGCLSYWRGLKSGKKSTRGYHFVRKEEYIPEFDYLGYKKTPRRPISKRIKKERIKKDPIPYSNRRLFRRPILSVKIDTGEEIVFPSVKAAGEQLGLLPSKMQMLLKRGFKERSHRGYWLRYI